MIFLKRIAAFTLIELVIFIVAMAILAKVILIPMVNSLQNAPKTSAQINANMLAQQCMEYILGQRLLKGYNTYSCPSTPSNSFCNSITNYTITTSVTCTTLGTDTNFKTLTVVVSGSGNATLNTLIANY